MIYITGADGTGKTTQADLLCAHLQKLGVRSHRVWLRFPFLFSMPLLAYARWHGLSWYEIGDGVRHGYWDFRYSWMLRTFLPWVLLIDATLASVVSVYMPLWLGKTIVCERFVLDMLADLIVAFDDLDLHLRVPGKLFLLLLPKETVLTALDLDADTIRTRRGDLRSDTFLDRRLRVYRKLIADLEMRVVHSYLPAEEINQQIWDTVIRSTESTKAFYNVSQPALLRSLISNPVSVVITHWVFQGMLYMDRTERIYKVSLDVVLTGIIALLIWWEGSHWLWAIIVAFNIAHTLNFILNGQIWVSLKHFGLVRHTYQEFDEYIAEFTSRLQGESSIQYAAVYGSLARNEWNLTSDLDVRLIRRPGLGNALRACTLVLRERARATALGFPIDLYVLDSAISLSKLRADEDPVILINRMTKS